MAGRSKEAKNRNLKIPELIGVKLIGTDGLLIDLSIAFNRKE